MPTLVETPGAATSNSYVSVADADAYFDARLNSSKFTGDSTDNKERALIQATRWLDRQASFEGEKASSGQALKWPRIWATDEDGEEYDSATIPAIIEDATCELALYLLNLGSTDPLMNTGLEQFEEAKVGPMDVTTRDSFRTGQLPDHVLEIISPVSTGSGLTVPLYRT